MVRHSQIESIGRRTFGRGFRISTAVALLMAAFTLLCRFFPSLADFYALHLYPGISSTLSLVSSFSPVNLEEPAILLLALAATALPVLAMMKRIKWKQALAYIAAILLWTYVWFWWAWCINYSRSSLYVRTGTTPSAFEENEFRTFTKTFVENINSSWTEERYGTNAELEENIKAFYSEVPAKFGLSTPRSWQHPKRIIANGLYSSVGIQGFMAPLFAESCINSDDTDTFYPFVYAHEYAHLMGVSSEAEASWWAYHACTTSASRAVRYSGYMGILPHLLRNAGQCMTEEEYGELFLSLRPEIREDLGKEREHWKALLSPAPRKLHEVSYDAFLKSNNVKAGRMDYSLVIAMLIDVEYIHAERTISN